MRSRLQTSVGLVGLPNVGKSTLFNALCGETRAFVANYPFATIDPNQALVPTPDGRLDAHALGAGSKSTVYDFVQINDIAGLIKGASQGQGLGNAFLGHIRSVDAVVHVVRCFRDARVLHVMDGGPRDPMEDIGVIELELVLADLDSVEKRLKVKKLEAEERGELMEVREMLLNGDCAKLKGRKLRNVNLLAAKPVLYALITDNADGDEVTKRVAAQLGADRPSLAISAQLESQVLGEPDLEMRAELAEEFGLGKRESSSIFRLSSAVAKLLNRKVFYTVGVQEARAWPLAPGDTAVDCASRIHNDIGAKLVNVEIRRGVDDKPRVEGKEYAMQDGDIAYFRHRA